MIFTGDLAGYKEELKAAKEALHLAQQQTSLQHEAHKEAEEEFVIHRRGTRAAGTPLNRVRTLPSETLQGRGTSQL